MLSNSASKTLTILWLGKAKAVLGVRTGNTLCNQCNPEGDSQRFNTYHCRSNLIVFCQKSIFFASVTGFEPAQQRYLAIHNCCCWTLLSGHVCGCCVYILYTKYQMPTAKTMVQVEFLMFALSENTKS